MRTLAVSLFLILFAATSASAGIVARVDVSKQTMTVSKDGRVVYSWRVSTGKKGYATPRGTYRPVRMERSWYSRKYDNAPMPHSIFFRGGYAIHGTDQVKNLGRPASRGCVRLAPGNAKVLFNLVRAEGPGDTRIVIQN